MPRVCKFVQESLTGCTVQNVGAASSIDGKLETGGKLETCFVWHIGQPTSTFCFKVLPRFLSF